VITCLQKKGGQPVVWDVHPSTTLPKNYFFFRLGFLAAFFGAAFLLFFFLAMAHSP
jgi:hypothetical protein